MGGLPLRGWLSTRAGGAWGAGGSRPGPEHESRECEGWVLESHGGLGSGAPGPQRPSESSGRAGAPGAQWEVPGRL